jgi:hypothetical protein
MENIPHISHNHSKSFQILYNVFLKIDEIPRSISLKISRLHKLNVCETLLIEEEIYFVST